MPLESSELRTRKRQAALSQHRLRPCWQAVPKHHLQQQRQRQRPWSQQLALLLQAAAWQKRLRLCSQAAASVQRRLVWLLCLRRAHANMQKHALSTARAANTAAGAQRVGSQRSWVVLLRRRALLRD
jgi:hypothetical protein